MDSKQEVIQVSWVGLMQSHDPLKAKEEKPEELVREMCRKSVGAADRFKSVENWLGYCWNHWKAWEEMWAGSRAKFQPSADSQQGNRDLYSCSCKELISANNLNELTSELPVRSTAQQRYLNFWPCKTKRLKDPAKPPLNTVSFETTVCGALLGQWWRLRSAHRNLHLPYWSNW